MRRARVLRRFLRKPLALGGVAILVAVFTFGAIFPWLTWARIDAIDLSDGNHGPTLSHWHVFGTNSIGQDVFLRSLSGLHTTEKTAFVATAIAVLLGVAVGGAAGYFGGWWDALLMRFADLLGVFPPIVVLLADALYVFPLTVWKTALTFGFYLWVYVARIVRAEIMALKQREFVDAAVAGGASNRRVFFRHLLPHAGATLTVAATAILAQVLILEATIEFFDLGIPSSQTPTLGNLIGDAEAAGTLFTVGWWTWVGPAAILALVLVCANVVGDGVADAMRVTDGRRRSRA
jgi:ABC-type dipeptide/oligopeptide/nickel transport system permease subunit